MTQNQKVYLYMKHSDGHWGLFWSFDAKCLFIEYYAYETQYRERYNIDYKWINRKQKIDNMKIEN